MEIIILDKKYKASELKGFSDNWYGILLKGTVDIELNRVALGGEWHIDSCEILTKTGSNKDNVWGFNLLFADEFTENTYQYHSMVNIKPSLNHKQMEVTDEVLIKKINKVLDTFLDLNN